MLVQRGPIMIPPGGGGGGHEASSLPPDADDRDHHQQDQMHQIVVDNFLGKGLVKYQKANLFHACSDLY